MGSARESGTWVKEPFQFPYQEQVRVPNVSITGTLSRQKARIRSPDPGSGPTNSGSVGLQCCLSFPFGKLIYHLPENLLAKSSETLSYKRSL